MKTKTTVKMMLAVAGIFISMNTCAAVFCFPEGSDNSKAPVEGTRVVIGDGVVRIVADDAADTAAATPSAGTEAPKTFTISHVDENISIERSTTPALPVQVIDEYISIEPETKGEIQVLESIELVTPPVEKADQRTKPANKEIPTFEPNARTIRTESDAGTGSAAIMPAPGFGPTFLKTAGTVSPVIIHPHVRSYKIIDIGVPVMMTTGIGTSLVTRGPPAEGLTNLSFSGKIPNGKFDLSSLKNGSPYSQAGIFAFYSGNMMGGLI